MELTSFVESWAKKWPGILKFATLVVFLWGLAAGSAEKKEGLSALGDSALLLAVAILLYLAGSWLDHIVFDPLYALKPSGWLKRLWRPVARVLFSPVWLASALLPGTTEMARRRKGAAERIWQEVRNEASTSCEGIYETAKTLLKDSEAWEDQVKPWLELSKVIRSFVWPVAAILIYHVAGGRRIAVLDEVLTKPIFGWLASWEGASAVLFAAIVLYVWLRALHMGAMYRLVEESCYIPFPGGGAGERRMAVAARQVPIGEAAAKKEQRPVFLLLGVDLPSRPRTKNPEHKRHERKPRG